MSNQTVGLVPGIGFFGVITSELPALASLDGFFVLPDKVGYYRFLQASINQEYGTSLVFDIIAGRNIQHWHSIILLGFHLGRLEQYIQGLATGKITDQFKNIIRRLLQQFVVAGLQPRNNVDDLCHTGDFEYMALT